MPPTTDTIAYGYAAAVFLGGLAGWLKAGSAVSGVMGIGIGAGLAYGAARVSKHPQQVHVILFFAGLLLLVMGMRFLKSGKWMPAGVLSLLSALMLVRYGQRLG